MKKLKPILLFLFIIFILLAKSQNLSVEWTTNSEGPGWELASDMMVDQEGNIYLIGNYDGTSKIEDNTFEGDEDIFIICYNKEGELQWKNTINNAGYCHISSFVPSSDNSFYITGLFQGQITIGAFELNAGTKINAFVAKINQQGQAGWLRQINGEFKGNRILIHPMNENKIIWASSFTDYMMINDSSVKSIPGTSDIVTILLSNKGELENFKLIQGLGDDYVNDLTCDENGLIYLAVSFEKEIKIKEISLKSTGRSDGAVIVLDSSLQPITIKQIGSINEDEVSCVAVDVNNNLIITGVYSGEIKLEQISLPQPTGKQDVFICKFKQDGQLLWADGFGGEANEHVSSIAVNKENVIYVSGNFRGEIEKNEQKANSTGFTNDLFIAKYYPNGKLKFIEVLGDTLTDFSRKLKIDSKNYIYLTGNRQKLNKDDKDTVPNDLESDFFLSKFYDCDFSEKITLGNDTCLCGDSFTIKADSTFKEYLWNDGTNDYIKVVDTTGLYYVTAINDHNCSSSDSIFIKLNPLPEFDLGDTIVVNKGETITLYGPTGMKAYRWSDNSTLFFLDVSTDKMNEGLYQYTLEVENENGCKTVDVVFIRILDTKEISEESDFIKSESFKASIFPNPAIDIMMLSLQNVKLDSKIEIQVFTSNGVKLCNYETTSLDYNIDIGLQFKDIPRGTYLLIIKNSKYIERFNIVLF